MGALCCKGKSKGQELAADETPPESLASTSHEMGPQVSRQGSATGSGSTLMCGKGVFGCRLLRQLRRESLAGGGSEPSLDMVMFGSFGQDLDNEKALCIAAALQRVGLLNQLSVIATTGDSKMRARLAKGTLNALGSKQCCVAAGSGDMGAKAQQFEFAHADYIAPEAELHHQSGHELFFSALESARERDTMACVVLNSVLTDFAAILADPRWEALRSKVASVTVSGGMTLGGAGLQMDETAGNNSPDLVSAKKVYQTLHAYKDTPFCVVTRHAAKACPIARNAFSGSMHPVALRLRLAAIPVLQGLWERVHRSEKERLLASDPLPARCDVAWFRATFLSDEAPQSLGPHDLIQDYATKLSESWSDGLATLVGVVSALPGLQFFEDELAPYVDPETGTRVLGLSVDAHGITDPLAVTDLLRELMVMVIGGGDGTLLRRAAEIAQSHAPIDLVLIGDYGKDLDDETALLVVAAFKHMGLIGEVSVVANLGDSKMRARLAKGTLQVLQLGGCPVAAGSHGGRPDEELYEHEFAHCEYLAEPTELFPEGGHELVFAAIQRAAAQRRQVCIILGSAMTDMATVLRDPRWSTARTNVLCVAAMAGVKEAEDKLAIDITAANNAFDPTAAQEVFDSLKWGRCDGGPQFVVTTRFAAGACQMPRGALDGAVHPVAKRLIGVQLPALQKLWERSHRTQEERERAKDALPMRCDVKWFRSTFLEERTPESLGPQDQVWQYVKGFNEYDALNLVAGIAAAYSPMLDEFFQCRRCPESRMIAIGVDPEHHGIAKPARMSELLHDCLVHAFEGRSKKGMKVEVLNHHGEWKTYLLVRHVREVGPDAWLAWETSKSFPTVKEPPLYLPPSLEGQTWRLKEAANPGDDEPSFVDPTLSYMYKDIDGQQGPHLHSHAAFTGLRQNFQTREGDVMMGGVCRSGRSSVHVISQALRGSKCLDSVDMSLPSTLEVAFARGFLDASRMNEVIDEKFGPIRVFKTYQPPARLPCRPGRGPLPDGLKLIYTVRDPRDVCVSQYLSFRGTLAADSERFTWPGYRDMFCKGQRWTGIIGPWLRQVVDMWKLHQRHPDQVLWVVFEDMLREPQKTVREVAAFLNVPVDDAEVDHLAQAMKFSELESRFGQGLGKIVLREGKVRAHKHFDRFTPEDNAKFQAELIRPALEAGVRLAPEVST